MKRRISRALQQARAQLADTAEAAALALLDDAISECQASEDRRAARPDPEDRPWRRFALGPDTRRH